MSIAITSVLSSSTADPADIRVVKAALNRLGLYQPDRDIGITAFTDAALFDGIRAFQKQKNLPVTGVIRPDDATARTLIWRTVQDDKVRSSHAGRNGQIFTEGRLPQGGHPGTEFGCRCWREAVPSVTTTDPTLTDPLRDAIEPVYPELFIVPFMRGGTAIKLAWEAWLKANNRDPEWRLSTHKSVIKWANRMEKRGWTPEKISEAIRKGKKFQAPSKINKENTATRYELDGKFVVRDDKTKEILQVSGGENFKPNEFPKGGQK